MAEGIQINYEFVYLSKGYAEFIRLSASFKKTSTELKKLEGTAKATSKSFKELSEQYKNIGNFAITAAKAFSALVGAADANNQLEKQRLILKNLAGNDYGQLQNAIRKTVSLSKNTTSEKALLEASKAALDNKVSVDFLNKSMETFQKISVVTGQSLSDLYKLPEKDRQKLLDKYTKDNVSMTKLQNDFNQVVGNGVYVQEQYDNSLLKLQQTLSKALLPAVIPLVDAFSFVIEYFTDATHGTERLQVAFIILESLVAGLAIAASYFGVSLLPPIIAATLAWASATWAAIAPLLPAIAAGIALGLVIAGITLAVKDLFAWFNGGDSVIKVFFEKAVVWVKSALNSLLSFAKTYGKYLVMAVFPISIIYFYFDDIKKAFNSLLDFAKTYGKYLIMAIFPISILYFYFDEIKNAINGFISYVTTAFSSINWNALIPDWVLSAAKSLSSIAGGSSAQAASGGLLGSLSGARASGGVVSAGKSYLVGERGPELFTPGSSGKIIPNGAGGGSVVVQSVVGTLTINVSGSNEAGTEIKEAVMRALDELSEDILPAKLGLAIT
ncbi:hypothetical protein CH352_14405 [Leptospira hartskeerlii]|uniref:Phage tail tape measure protein n=1 Tax=Leptospira hartskeerlii TaxID=2023177 RepID=A0A2M9X9N1_9LEPT|nr:hypothetical protein [Leptospira hartskeerlii]PJZ24403.1 hypothetical protein CH357_15100 [Leptospira hartskeerlii]PJZ32985.1 hypothetical protein CH352_14405 [Leptospira hartskeerlii]